MLHKKEWVQLPYEGALYQSLGANTNKHDCFDAVGVEMSVLIFFPNSRGTRLFITSALRIGSNVSAEGLFFTASGGKLPTNISSR